VFNGPEMCKSYLYSSTWKLSVGENWCSGSVKELDS
jgi:hypothetical protein